MVKLEGWKARVVLAAALINLTGTGLTLLILIASMFIH